MKTASHAAARSRSSNWACRAALPAQIGARARGHRAAVGVGDPAAGLGDQQQARGDVPGVEVALPVAVEAAGGDPGEVQRRGAEAADAGHPLADLVQLLQEGRVLAVAQERDAGGQHRLVHPRARGDPQALVVEEGSPCPSRPRTARW